MREFLVVFLLLLVQEVLDIDWSKISQAKTNDVLPDMLAAIRFQFLQPQLQLFDLPL